ncbi:MAG: hypothetical protein J5449_01820 [Oscillospiraceae bacterium]|nr:hypothetical protein [Oscillospiraceae bacterium]
MRRVICLLLLSAVLLCACAQSVPVPEEESAPPPAEQAAEPLTEEPAEPPEPEPEPEPQEVEAPPPALDLDARPVLIAHAGGAIWGYRLTNSLEALELAYAGGHRFIEVDISRSADGELVLLHDWESMARRMFGTEGCLTEEEFLARRAFARLTLMDLDALLDWLKAHPDCSIITDVKDEEGNVDALSEIRRRAGELGDHFIPQVYDYGEYDAVSQLGYARVILTLYRLETEPDRLGDFAAAHRPWGITVAQDRLTRELLDAVLGASPDTLVFAHTVNDLSFFEAWQPQGLSGIYTDYFTPDRWYPSIIRDPETIDSPRVSSSTLPL